MGQSKVTEQEKQPEPEPIQPELEQENQEEPAPKWKLQVLADKEAKWSESRYWKEFAIGHAWIRMIAPTGQVDSWGYWPDLEGGHGVDPSAPWKSVPGRCRHPDTAHVPNAQHTYDIEDEAAQKVITAANGKVASPGMYNLFTYNCTTFAIEMANVAGVSAPGASTLGVMNPNSLHAGITEMNKKAGQDSMEREVDAEPN